MCGRRHNNECHDSDLTPRTLETVIQPGESLDKHIHALIPVFVPPRREEVQCIIQVKVIMSIKMSTDKIINDVLLDGMQVLKLVHSLEFNHVETIR
jgi:hypothetical protein